MTDRQVTVALATITLFGHAAIARLIAILAEFDERQLHRPLGFTSLFAYCTTQLGFSQDEAFHRIRAARAVRKFPAILDHLEKGALNLTSLRLLLPHLTADNHADLLETASRKKLTDVELLIARLKPRPDIPSSIRKLPAIGRGRVDPSLLGEVNLVPTSPTSGSSKAATSGASSGSVRESAGAAASAAGIAPDFAETSPPAAPRSADPRLSNAARSRAAAAIGLAPFSRSAAPEIPARRAIVQPLSEASYRLQVTLTKQSYDALRMIQALIRHSIPSGDPALIVARAFDLLLQDLRKKRTADVARPMPPGAGTPRSRRIPAHVQRRVWKRDGGRCAFVSKDGRRCDTDGFLELHHVTPYARGGKATAANIQLRCRAHNQYEAEAAGLKRRR